MRLAAVTAAACLLAAALYVVLSEHGSGSSAAGRPPPPPALLIRVTGARCLVFVRRPGGDVLVNTTLTSGQSVRFDGPPFDVVLGDASAVTVYVRGVPRPAGPATFTVF